MNMPLDPKNTKWSIKKVKRYNIDPIKNAVMLFDKEWDIDTSRQETYKPHKDTKMFQLRYMDYDWNSFSGIKPKYYDTNKLSNDFAQIRLLEIFNDLEQEYGCTVVRVEFVNMLAHTSIRPHLDGGDMLNVSRRCHIPIITNPDVSFTVLDNTVNMEEGYCYEINNGMLHSVKNDSDFDRVHLIIDLLPNKYL
jgi:hypothetical protein